MAASNYARAFALTLKHEGGYVDNAADPGGATNLGVTIGTLSTWLGRRATKAEVRALTKDSVAPIYRRFFWDVIRGDDLPAGVDYAVYDFGVNSGPRRGAQALQRAVGVADDGKIGPVTLAAVASKPADQIVQRICADRLRFLKGLKTWRTFGKGWGRRVDEVQAAALEMARKAPAPVAKPRVDPPAAPASPAWEEATKAVPAAIPADVPEPVTITLVPASGEAHDAQTLWERVRHWFGAEAA